jgi:uncharacterized protein YjdB
MKLNNKTIVLNQTKVKSSGTIRGSQSKIFALLFAICSLLIGFGACENPSSAEKTTKTVITEVEWNPVMVIALKTISNESAILSFMSLTPKVEATKYYSYRLHFAGDIISKGTVTVTDGTTFNFISDSGKKFSASLEDTVFNFDNDVPTDSGEITTLTFQTATVPSTNEPAIPAQSIALNINTLEFNLDDATSLTAVLTATILPVDADMQLWWSSSKPQVAKVVPNGASATITVLSVGTATIKVKAVKGGKVVTCAVTVTKAVEPGLFLEDGGELISLTEELDGDGSFLSKAISWLNTKPGTNDLYPAGVDGKYRIILGEAEPAITTTSNNATYTLSKNVTVTLEALNETVGTITKSATGTGALFYVCGITTNDIPHLILGNNITLKGAGSEFNNKRPLVLVGSASYKGQLTMNDTNCRITGNTNSDITYGGGVRVYTSSIFTMNGGRIDHNKSTNNSGQGGGVRNEGTFTMNGGSIDNNLVGSGSSGSPYGGGVHSASGTFVMIGGSIHSNIATSSVEATAQGGSGGGVCAKTFEMKGGKIENNTAERGGGIFLLNNADSTVTIDAGSIIRGNHATVDGRGSAFELIKGTFIKKSGSIIYGINETETFVIGEETFNVSNCKTNTPNSGYSIFIRNIGSATDTVKYFYNGTAGTTVELNTNEATSWSTSDKGGDVNML